MMEWRPKQPTRWNRQCTYILRKILPTLELGTGSFVSSEEESEFERLLQQGGLTNPYLLEGGGGEKQGGTGGLDSGW